MTCYLLDTNIISNVTKPAPSKALIAWMTEVADEDMFISSLTIAEIRRGLLEKPAGRRATRIGKLVRRPGGAAEPCSPAVSSRSTRLPP